jgi:hypothetical protein
LSWGYDRDVELSLVTLGCWHESVVGQLGGPGPQEVAISVTPFFETPRRNDHLFLRR